MKSAYRICDVLGIPVRLHITLLFFLPLLVPYIASGLGLNLLLALVAVAGFFASITLHELGHSVVAMRHGCTVRQILLMPIGGVAQLTHIPESPRAEILVALAGPAVSLVLAIVAGLVAFPLHALGLHGLTQVFTVWAAVNLVLLLFNLLPSFPMDGGRVFRALMTPRIGRLRATRIASQLGRIMAVLFGLYGLWRLNFILVAIAFFIHRAAGAEYRMVEARESWRGASPYAGYWFGSRPPPVPPEAVSDEVVVGPPPYAHGTERAQRRRLFDEAL